MLPDALQEALEPRLASDDGIIVLTGAGISAESGIPTFRGPEGYWKIGSRDYMPQEIGTLAMFRRDPDAVWRWYLFRRTVCRRAEPNAGHRAVVEMEAALGDRFTLITQNVDGLHLRAGSSRARALHVHGSLESIRCAAPCGLEVHPFPDGVGPYTRDTEIREADRALLACPGCGGPTRPHVLWFDEYYDERFYRFETALQTAAAATLLITVGTSGATNLPNHVVDLVIRGGGLVIDVNLADNRFGQAATRHGGFALRASSAVVLPALAEALTRRAHPKEGWTPTRRS